MHESMFYIFFKDTIGRTEPLCFNNKNVLKLIIILEMNMTMEKTKTVMLHKELSICNIIPKY